MGDTQQQGTTGGTPDTGQQTEDKSGQGSTWTPPASQEELNRIIEGRIARVKAGYADYDQLKATATEYAQFKESQLSEQEKAIKAAREEGEKSVSEKYARKLLNAEVKAGAARLKFHDPADAITALGDLENLVTKDGEIDADAVSKVLTELAEKKPYLVEAEAGPKVATRSRVNRSTETTDTPPAKGKGRAADALRQFASGR
jgi:hypothetical protein